MEERISHIILSSLLYKNYNSKYICNRCGIVAVQDLEDTKKIQYKTEDSTTGTRNGNSTSLTIYDRGLAILIGNTNRDASGNVINSMMMIRLNKMRYQDKRSQINNAARNLIRAFRQLDSLKDKLALTNAVIEKTDIFTEKYRKPV